MKIFGALAGSAQFVFHKKIPRQIIVEGIDEKRKSPQSEDLVFSLLYRPEPCQL